MRTLLLLLFFSLCAVACVPYDLHGTNEADPLAGDSTAVEPGGSFFFRNLIPFLLHEAPAKNGLPYGIALALTIALFGGYYYFKRKQKKA